MQIADFALERYFARWEFSVRHLLCASDVEAYPMRDLLAFADDEMRDAWENLRLGYTESTGHPLLREAIAGLYSSASPNDVVTCVGAEEAIFLTMHALLCAGDHAIVVWPAYQSLYEVGRSIGAAVTLVPLEPKDWSLDPEAVIAAIRPNTRVIVINFPHSPTGALIPQSTFDCLTAAAEARGITLLSDEVYRYLEFDEAQRLPAAVDIGRHSVSLGVMSKSFALAGLRVGWIATHDDALRQRMCRLKDYTTICGSAPSEILATIALRSRERVLARSREIIAGNLPLLDRFFESFGDELEWTRPRAGSVAFPRLRTNDAGAIDRFCAELVEREGVLLLPGSQFQHDGNHFRIGYGRADMARALERLERFLAGRAAANR